MPILSAEDRLTLLEPRDKPGVLPDDTMSEAGRKIFAFHCARMISKEAGVREGSDPKDVHDMRVATRRMRSAIPIFEDYYRGPMIKQARKMLRRVARALGDVRDVDVLRLKTTKYAEKYDQNVHDGLQPLLDAWDQQQEAARIELENLLDSESFEQFLINFTQFLNTSQQDAVDNDPDVTEPLPMLVRTVVPRVLYEKLEAARAYETILDNATFDALHALRIKAKELRYALEAFEEVLSQESKTVIDAAKALQDHLGELQDARVATARMHNYLADADETQPMTVVLHYLATRQAEKQKLRNEVNLSWRLFNRIEVRRALANSIAAL
ncbi:MAG: CHAD domain-containing protein [Anaerolineae bacterium]|nr:CHAD domain-containing protein [Anaerolineae bacterium]